MRKSILCFIYQISIMSSLMEEIWIHISASTFNHCDITCHIVSGKPHCTQMEKTYIIFILLGK